MSEAAPFLAGTERCSQWYSRGETQGQACDGSVWVLGISLGTRGELGFPCCIPHCTSWKGAAEFDFTPQHGESLKDFRLDGVHNDQEVLAGHFRAVIGKVTNTSSRGARQKVQGQGGCDQIPFFAPRADGPWSHFRGLNQCSKGGCVEASSVWCPGLSWGQEALPIWEDGPSQTSLAHPGRAGALSFIIIHRTSTKALELGLWTSELEHEQEKNRNASRIKLCI